MSEVVSEITLRQFVAFCRKHYAKSRGWKYVWNIIRCRGTGIHPTRLYHLEMPVSDLAREYDNPSFTYARNDYIHYWVPELPIEAMDELTFYEVRDYALSVLDAYNCAVDENLAAEMEKLQAEMKTLTRYLRQGVKGVRSIEGLRTQNGKRFIKDGDIRFIADKTHADAHLINSALNTLHANLLKTNPAMAEFMEAHLDRGHLFKWKGGRY